jgi:hypothetical protein
VDSPLALYIVCLQTAGPDCQSGMQLEWQIRRAGCIRLFLFHYSQQVKGKLERDSLFSFKLDRAALCVLLFIFQINEIKLRCVHFTDWFYLDA